MRRAAEIGAAIVLALAVLTLGGLAIAGTRPMPVRTFALGAPNQTAVVVLQPGRRVCESNISSRGAFDQVGIFGASVGAPGRLAASIRARGDRRLSAIGSLVTTPTPAELFIPLSPRVAGGSPITVCLRNVSRAAFSLLGSPTVRPGVTMSGSHGKYEFSLVLRRSTGQSFLSSLPLAFSRAALWRPSWVGPWTYWTLLGLLVLAFPVAALTVAAATSEDGEPAGRGTTRPDAEAGSEAQ